MRTHKVVPARNTIGMISVAKVIGFTTSPYIADTSSNDRARAPPVFCYLQMMRIARDTNDRVFHVNQTLAKEHVAPSAHAEIVTSGKSEDVSSWRRTRASDWTPGLVRYADLARHYSSIPGATAGNDRAQAKA